MPRRNEIAQFLVIVSSRKIGCIGVALIVCSRSLVLAAPEIHKDRNVYCVQSDRGDWMLQTYPPLINPRSNQVIIQVLYDGTRLEEMRIRRFDPAYELTFAYKFTASGKLSSLDGIMRKWGGWVAQTDLFPGPDGVPGLHRVEYFAREGRSPMSEPDDGPRYASALRNVVVYRTTAEIPCASLLKEMEKKNATP